MKKAIPIQDLLSLIIFGDLIKDNIEFILLLVQNSILILFKDWDGCFVFMNILYNYLFMQLIIISDFNLTI